MSGPYFNSVIINKVLPVPTATITLQRYEELCEDQELLNALRAAGVDGWAGYENALDYLEGS